MSASTDRSEQLLQTLQGHIEDIRNLLTCSVCIRPMYEPFTLSCGHTFCYSCLRAWFGNNRYKKTCPECRTIINAQPGPAYLVREIVHYFTGQTELLPEGETLDNHWEHRIDELNRLEEDKSNKDPATGGLFQGTFNDGDNFPLSPIHDLDDGVVRCPRCTHELEEGQCNRCGYIYDRDGSDELDDDGEDIDYDDFDDDRTVDLDFESDALPEDESEMPFHDYDAPWAEAIERARREYRRRSHSAEDGDENEENSEEDENSEMDDFIVEDEEGDERSSRPHYSDSSLSNSEGRFGFDGHHDSARIEDDDSDVHLIRHRPRRRVISIEDDDDESSDEETDASQGEHRSRVNGRAHSVSEHELSSDGDRYNEDDDEKPILARSRRRRRLSDTISDSDAEGSTSHRRSGTESTTNGTGDDDDDDDDDEVIPIRTVPSKRRRLPRPQVISDSE